MLKNKNVLITGASSGLGEALAMDFAKRNANLTLCARRLDRLQALKDQIFKLYPQIDILTVATDVGSKEESNQLIQDSITHFGGLDVFVANAGQGMWSRFRDLSDPDQLLELMKINYMGVVYGLYFSLPALRESQGSFIAISSIQGLMPVIFHTGYVASKFAVNGLVETIRLEEPDVHFLLALPSWISGTELRSHAVSGASKASVQVKKTHGKSAVSKEECARIIIDAMLSKKREVFIPKKYHCLPILRDLFKSSFDRVVTAKVKGQLSE